MVRERDAALAEAVMGEGKSALNTYSLTSVGSCVVSILKEQ